MAEAIEMVDPRDYRDCHQSHRYLKATYPPTPPIIAATTAS